MRAARAPHRRTPDRAPVAEPPGIVEIPGLTQVIVASGSRHVYVAGQIPIDAAGELIGPGDLQAQAVAAFEHLRTCLDAAGATPADVEAGAQVLERGDGL